MTPLLQFAPESWLFKYSLWDECDGEPINCWADELVLRDGALCAAMQAEVKP